jgi:heterodisulfide reductase subunit A-like polyferredoxin
VVGRLPIAGTTSFDQIVKAAEQIPMLSSTNDLFCGADGQDVIAKDISDGLIDRFVTIVSCSPKMHSQTFGKVCQRTNLNPYML